MKGNTFAEMAIAIAADAGATLADGRSTEPKPAATGMGYDPKAEKESKSQEKEKKEVKNER